MELFKGIFSLREGERGEGEAFRKETVNGGAFGNLSLFSLEFGAHFFGIWRLFLLFFSF